MSDQEHQWDKDQLGQSLAESMRFVFDLQIVYVACRQAKNSYKPGLQKLTGFNPLIHLLTPASTYASGFCWSHFCKRTEDE